MIERQMLLADEQATESLGAHIAEHLVDGLIVYLSGDLGAGKTTLVRGMLYALGHAGAVKSPTYALVEEYRLGNRRVYHFDLYRLHDPEELELIGMRDYFDGKACSFVEWPEQGRDYLPKPDLEIRVRHEGSGRRAALSAFTGKGRRVVEAIEADS